MLMLFGLESYYYHEDYIDADKKRLENFLSFQSLHPVFGYANTANSKYVARKFYDNQHVYDSSITIDSRGLRITTPEGVKVQPTNESLIFFGDSYTFGQGVNDDQSLPYITNSLTGGKFSVYNFGISGYGPQHMLAAIEYRVVDSIVKEKPRLVIYQTIVDHVYRVAGLRQWLRGGPRYLLSNSGKAIYAGNFIQCHPAYDNCFIKRVKNQLTKSYLFQRLVLLGITNHEIELFIKVVDQSRQLLQERFPDMEFHVLFWHQPKFLISNAMLRALKEKDFNVHIIPQIIPDYKEQWAQYHILHDGHPNALRTEK